jgi:hypothetical protein
MVFHWANTWKASSENEVTLFRRAQDDPSYQAWLQQATPEELSALGNKKADKSASTGGWIHVLRAIIASRDRASIPQVGEDEPRPYSTFSAFMGDWM